MHTYDLREGSSSNIRLDQHQKHVCWCLPPTTTQLKNLVISYQVLSVNSDTNDGSYNFHELIHDSEEYFVGSFMDEGSLFEDRSIPSKITISVMVRSISRLEGTLLHERKVPQRCDLQGTYNERLTLLRDSPLRKIARYGIYHI